MKIPVKNHKKCAVLHITMLPPIMYQWAEVLMGCNQEVHDILKMIFLIQVLIPCAQNVSAISIKVCQLNGYDFISYFHMDDRVTK